MLFSDPEGARIGRDRSCRHRGVHFVGGVVGVYAFAVSSVLAKVIDRLMGFRISAEDETTGVDFTQHAETAYAEAVHGYQPSRRPTSFGDLGAPGLRPETAEEA